MNKKDPSAVMLGKRSAEARQKKAGKKQFSEDMRELAKKRWLNKATK